MRKSILALLVFSFCSFCPLLAQSATDEANDPSSLTQTAVSMAEQQADFLDRKLNLTERQREKVIRMYTRFNEDFAERRSAQQGSDQSDIRTMLQEQSTRRNRELRRILTEQQYELYLEGQAEGQRSEDH
ncbi:MAG: hypothetical protein AAFY91_18970 [Bacteroidota bacterium]